MKKTTLTFLVALALAACTQQATLEPVDYVNPNIGTISHLLVPTYPTVHLPNSMMRVYPNRENYTTNHIQGLPLIVTGHRGGSSFFLSPFQGDVAKAPDVISMSYDNEVTTPYSYNVDLDEMDMQVAYAPSHQSAVYEFTVNNPTQPLTLLLGTRNGDLQTDGKSVSGYEELGRDTRVYIYLEPEQQPASIDLKGENEGRKTFNLAFPAGTKEVRVRYGVSYISAEQAQKNMQREVAGADVKTVAAKGRDIWNKTLGKVQVTGGTDDEKQIFYTSLYRTYERMVCVSEDGQYWGYDKQVHSDEGTPYLVDDWIWDTYRAVHPLRLVLEPTLEGNIINSFIRMAEQQTPNWMPTFPGIAGNSNTMNCNHAVASVLDAWTKGVQTFDLAKAYQYSKAAITEKTLAPWSGKPAGVLDAFFKKHGYFPALAVGETETVPEVHDWEHRQPVAVTLGTVYDEWCLGNIATILKNQEDADYFLQRSGDYKTIYNAETGFFHPKDSFGNFIEPFDYRFPTGIGARDSYDENTGYEYRWDVQHNIADLIQMMGGKSRFVAELEDMFSTPIGMNRYTFYATYPDHSGNVGQFSMGNEPALHIPYLYNYAGEAWRTQKRVRSLLKQWFRNDLMGIPGDEDGGGMTSFVVFSMMGFYPVTPGLPMYVIGSPVFQDITLNLENGKTFLVKCQNYDPENKYIQSAKLNGKEWTKSWFTHEDLMNGGTLELVMGRQPNKAWGADEKDLPPSFKMN
ncbi:MAG: GH92 family glycosyl hydrolase [Bacteroidales bacterium]|nr:GH92 family glycosyl hydrolase [Bacteroidales bacterium]